MLKCIFCDNLNEAISIEHIVPESFGNTVYVMEKSTVCDQCNSNFAKFEALALANSVYVMERARLGVITKKGKNVKGQIEGLNIEGDEKFTRNQIYIKGITTENFKNYNPKTGIGQLHVASFDKSEESSCKLALKIALESIYKSEKTIYNKYDFKDLKDYLTKKNNKDWPFLMTDYENKGFTSIPKFKVKYDLKYKNHCELRFLEIDNYTLLFKFRFGSISLTLNLLDRNINWIQEYANNDKLIQIYPKHYRNKVSYKNRIDNEVKD